MLVLAKAGPLPTLRTNWGWALRLRSGRPNEAANWSNLQIFNGKIKILSRLSFRLDWMNLPPMIVSNFLASFSLATRLQLA